MIEIGISAHGGEVFIRGLEKVREEYQSGLLQEAGDAAVASILKRTLAGRDEDDRPMQPTKRPGSQMLWSRGHMLGSMAPRNTRWPRTFINFSGGTPNNGTLAWWHQHGTHRKSGNVGVPERRFFGFSPSDVRNIQAAVDDFADRTVRGSGLA